MRTLRILITAFLAGVVLASCKPITAVCAPLDVVVDTLGWVIRPAGDTAGPITATHPSCITIRPWA